MEARVLSSLHSNFLGPKTTPIGFLLLWSLYYSTIAIIANVWLYSLQILDFLKSYLLLFFPLLRFFYGKRYVKTILGTSKELPLCRLRLWTKNKIKIYIWDTVRITIQHILCLSQGQPGLTNEPTFGNCYLGFKVILSCYFSALLFFLTMFHQIGTKTRPAFSKEWPKCRLCSRTGRWHLINVFNSRVFSITASFVCTWIIHFCMYKINNVIPYRGLSHPTKFAWKSYGLIGLRLDIILYTGLLKK